MHQYLEAHYSNEWSELTRVVALGEWLRDGAEHISWGPVWYVCDHPMHQYLEDHHCFEGSGLT